MAPSIHRTANTIANQARRLGYTVSSEVAGTGTIYLTVSHVAWCACAPADECDGFCEDKVIRISDHEANEARYQFHVNRQPDLDCNAGYQAGAVKRLCQWIGVKPEALAYIRRHNTIHKQLQAAKEAACNARTAERTRIQAIHRKAMAALSQESLAIFQEYEQRHGKARKAFRRSGRYRHALAELTQRISELMGPEH